MKPVIPDYDWSIFGVRVILLLKEMSGTLFFLANKSQEQVTEDYKILSKRVSDQLSKLEIELKNRVVSKTIR